MNYHDADNHDTGDTESLACACQRAIQRPDAATYDH